jgi:hypothetical protein
MMCMREVKVSASPGRQGYKSVWGESTSRVHLGVLYMVQDMHSFISKYFSTEVLVLHANRCRAAQVE